MKKLMLMLITFATSLLAQTNKVSTEVESKQSFSNHLPESVKLKEIANICSTNTNFLTGIGNYTLINRIHKILSHKKINNKIKSDNTIEIEAKNMGLLEEIENIQIETNPKILIDKKNGIILASENASIGTFTFFIEKDDKSILNNKKTTIQINAMKLNEFVLTNSNNFSHKELIQIIQAAKKSIN
ncbi:flagellar basal body P-ring protein FlgI [Borrelia yangtzensis]|uniref:Flagellar basal body P-ring protein FlgI n=1 Tax=Borreliella yangtzensis TaxID=683292 RepID=A0ABR6P907_9SPIR|nr:flagellar basal body P-ring protein FlgI [Borreliella yangtzensis]